MTTSVIVAGARTPVGKLMGSLKDFSGSDLGAVAIAGALEKAGVPASAVEYVIMGQVLTAGAGQMPARQAAVAAGIPMDVPALSINTNRSLPPNLHKSRDASCMVAACCVVINARSVGRLANSSAERDSVLSRSRCT